jgi:Protein of Unknown function (DUF2784)
MMQAMAYRLLADIVLIMHAAFIAFVILGLVLILIGAVRSWGWIRNIWFRLIHLLAIGIVVAESWFGGICPLTEWESRLREAAGGVGYRESFVAHWLHELIFYDIAPRTFTALYTGFGIVVLLVWLGVPPRGTWR